MDYCNVAVGDGLTVGATKKMTLLMMTLQGIWSKDLT